METHKPMIWRKIRLKLPRSYFSHNHPNHERSNYELLSKLATTSSKENLNQNYHFLLAKIPPQITTKQKMLTLKKQNWNQLRSFYQKDPKMTIVVPRTQSWKRGSWIKFRLNYGWEREASETLKLMRERLKLGNQFNSNIQFFGTRKCLQASSSLTPTMLMLWLVLQIILIFFSCFSGTKNIAGSNIYTFREWFIRRPF